MLVELAIRSDWGKVQPKPYTLVELPPSLTAMSAPAPSPPFFQVAVCALLLLLCVGVTAP